MLDRERICFLNPLSDFISARVEVEKTMIQACSELCRAAKVHFQTNRVPTNKGVN